MLRAHDSDPLDQSEKDEISKRLKRSNRKIWTDERITHVYDIINKIRDGTYQRKDWFIPNLVTYDDYIYQLNLIKFV
jgi:hypothetical protein